VIPPLIDLQRFRPDSNEAEIPRLLFLGNLSETKGVRPLLRAFSQVLEKFPDAELCLALDMTVKQFHDNRTDVHNLISELDIGDSVRPIGIVEDLPQFMNSCEMLLVPFTSMQGPADYPLSMLEAMACELPVVASNIGGIPEVIDDGENGILVGADSEPELLDAITELLDSPSKRRKIGQNARKTIDDLSRSIVSEHMDLYCDVTNE
jgi:glycosyltransferase involved in cell wall biosynthesis